MRASLGGGLLAGVLAGCVNSSGSGAAPGADNAAVYDDWQAQRSYVEVTASGTVTRLLGTRRGPSGDHEGFLMKLDGAGRGLTIRVEDNVGLTGPVPLVAGDALEVRGEYIFDPRGGLVHYTHRDPSGRHAAGFILTGGRLYQ